MGMVVAETRQAVSDETTAMLARPADAAPRLGTHPERLVVSRVARATRIGRVRIRRSAGLRIRKPRKVLPARRSRDADSGANSGYVVSPVACDGKGDPKPDTLEYIASADFHHVGDQDTHDKRGLEPLAQADKKVCEHLRFPRENYRGKACLRCHRCVGWTS